MRRTLNVAVFGLSLNILDEIKTQILLSVPTDIKVHFVTLSEPNIDLLFVNDAFFNSASIQKVLSCNVAKYLRLVKDPKNSGKIINDTLFYPFTRLDDLTDWIEDKFVEGSDKAQSSIEEIDSSSFVSAYLAQDLVDPIDVFTEIFTARNGFIKIFDSTGFLALIDTRTERVWITDRNKPIIFDRSLNQTYATNQFVQDLVKQHQAQDLKVWLWKVLNHSMEMDLALLKPHQAFRLHSWPQFEKGIDRSDLLKMAACFAQGAKISDVEKALHLPIEKILKFVARAQLLRMGEVIEVEQVKFKQQQLAEQQTTEEGAGLRGFFGKLRKKLGI